MFGFIRLGSRSPGLSSALLFAGKAGSIILAILIIARPDLITLIPAGMRPTIGFLAVLFAGLGLLSTLTGFFKVAAVAGLWIIAIGCLSHSFFTGEAEPKRQVNLPVSLPDGRRYQEIPEARSFGDEIASYIPDPSGVLGGAYARFTGGAAATTDHALEQAADFFDFNLLPGSKDPFGALSIRRGALPDSAYFPSGEKKNFYPIGKTKGATTGLTGVLENLLPK